MKRNSPNPLGSVRADCLEPERQTGVGRARQRRVLPDLGVPAGPKTRRFGSALWLAGLFASLALTTAQAAPNVVVWGGYGNIDVPASLTNAVAVAGGYQNSLALRADGTVVAWGDNSFGQTIVPVGLTNVVAVASLFSHSLALRADGSVVGWGQVWNDRAFGYVPTTVPDGLTNVVAIAAGDSHSLALTADGTVVAWGSNGYGQTNVPAGLANVVAVAGGGEHSLALRADGTVVAWGCNTVGQATGVPTTSSPWISSGEVRLAGKELTNVVAVAGGGAHSLALRADGTVVAWGANEYGQTNVPARLTNVVAVAGGMGHSLALRADGTVVAWGYYGTLPVPANLTNVVAVAGGRLHSLALVGTGPPLVTTTLLDRTILAGETVPWRVTACGQWPLSYQWQSNGTNLPGATNSLLLLTNVQMAQAGAYAVIVSNAIGTVTNKSALLTVFPALIRAQPQSQLTIAGRMVTLTVAVQANAPLSYQWCFNGTNLLGATDSSLTLSNVSLDQAGAYWVVASNRFGTVTSSNATLTVLPIAAWPGQSEVPASLTNVLGIAAGYDHRLALKTDGTAVAWGQGYHGETSVPAGLTNVVSVAGGYCCSVALRGDGTVAAWGWNDYGQTNVPVDLTNAVAVAAGYRQNLALRSDGQVVAWGQTLPAESRVPAWLRNVVGIAAGYDGSGSYHSLALKGDGTVVAWGWNEYGQSTVPAGLTNVITIAAGAYHSLALKGDGTVAAWGAGTTNSGSWPHHGQAIVPAGLTNVAAIAAGSTHSLALRSDGTVVAWGDNGSGQTNVPVGLTNVAAIAAGGNQSLALVGDGTPALALQPATQGAYTGADVVLSARATGGQPLSYQWQFNGTNLADATNASLVLSHVEAGDAGSYSVVVSNALNVAVSRSAALTVTSGPPLILAQPDSQRTVPGGSATFQVIAEGSQPLAYQWRLESLDLEGAIAPVLVLNNVTYSQAGCYSVVVTGPLGPTTSSNATLAVVPVVGWGDNFYGQRDVAADLTNVLAIAAGGDHSLALKPDGTVVAWGDDLYGQTDVPAGLTNGVAIAAGYYHGLALKRDGTVVGWDWNDFFQVDAPLGLSNAVAVAAGGEHSLALKSDGTVVAWGDNYYGQSEVPAGLTNAVAIAAGYYHSLALKNDGTVAAWGGNDYGQTSMPAGLTNIVAIAARGWHSLALKSDGRVVAWGDNSFGQATVPTNLTSIIALGAGEFHSLALRVDGTVIGWGAGAIDTGFWPVYGQCIIPPGLKNVVAIAGGAYHSLALAGEGSPVLSLPLLNPHRNNTTFSVSLPTQSGRIYALEFKDSLAETGWRPLPLVAGDGGLTTLIDPTASGVQRFYRVRQW